MSSKIFSSITRHHSQALELGFREGCNSKLARVRQTTSLASRRQQNPNHLPVVFLNSPLLKEEIVYQYKGITVTPDLLAVRVPRLGTSLTSSQWQISDPFKFLEEDNINKSLLFASVPLKDSKSFATEEALAQNENPKEDSSSEKPNSDRMQKLHDVITNSLSKLFSQPMDYSVYNPDVIFIDNIRNKTTHGILKYVQQVALLRAVGHFKFAFVKFEILNTHISQEESRITVRWRIRGISGLRVMLKFWKYRLWKWQEIVNQQENWYDGVSYFDIGTDGLVYRHIADKMMEDKNREIDVAKHSGKTALAAKLGVLAALFPTPSLISFSNKSDQHETDTLPFDIGNSGLNLSK